MLSTMIDWFLNLFRSAEEPSVPGENIRYIDYVDNVVVDDELTIVMTQHATYDYATDSNDVKPRSETEDFSDL